MLVGQGGAAAKIPGPPAVLPCAAGTGLLHHPAAQTADHLARQGMDLAAGAAAGPTMQHLLDPLEIGGVNDGFMGVGDHDPVPAGQPDGPAGLVAHPPVPPLLQVPGVGTGGQKPVDGGLGPALPGSFATIIRYGSFLQAVAPRRQDALGIEQAGDAGGAVPGQIQPEDPPHHPGGFRVDDQTVVVGRVLGIPVQRKGADVLPRLPLVGEYRADVGGQVFQIPLVDEAVDLPAFLAGGVGGVHMVHHRNEPDAPQRKQPVQVFFHQLHIPGEAGLGLDQDHIEFPRPGGRQQPVESGAAAVNAGVVLVGIDARHLVALLSGVVQQHGALVLDAFGFPGTVGQGFVLLAQAAVDGGPHPRTCRTTVRSQDSASRHRVRRRWDRSAVRKTSRMDSGGCFMKGPPSGK